MGAVPTSGKVNLKLPGGKIGGCRGCATCVDYPGMVGSGGG